MQVQLASPETILSWSFGEVTKPETINYRSFKPEKDGLFCEKIFGPVKDWECNCGKYKRIRYRGVVCDRCGVEVTQAKVRRERLGHIKLAVPVSHIWYFKGIPSRIGHLLDMSVRDLERILYYESYVVTDPKDTPLQQKELLSEERFIALRKEFGADGFAADMGAGAIKDLLTAVNIEELASELRVQVKVETSVQRKKETLKRLKVVEAFRQSGNEPEWMILDVVPVLPPDLRPLVPLEGGRFATSDLNDLYRRVINRNNRLKKLMEIRAPEVILRNEKRMLQEAVDALFDNGRRSRAVRGPGNRPLKSLSDMLKGKQGRFRQNLLGKRVDYSGRSVIVVGPELKLHQCGLPKNMALELFKPFIIKKLEDKGYVQTVKSAKKLVEREKPEVWDILEEIIRDHPVLLNRAPTLHRLGIQAFQPVLVEGKAIRIHPLVCAAFNADFDGDQMAVHVPLSFEAQIEARVLMLSSHNILAPASGRPLASPSQDIVIGCHYLTHPKPGAKGDGMACSGPNEVEAAYLAGAVELNTPIKVRINGKTLSSTVGRVFFNQIVPEELGYINETMDKGALERIVSQCHSDLGGTRTAQFLDELKNLGFQYATTAGITVGIDDIMVPPEKASLIGDAQRSVDQIYQQYKSGHITNGERYNKVIDTWTRATNEVADHMFRRMGEAEGGFNSVFMMANSGSRGSKEQIRQLAGMRGLMAKPQKKLTGQMGEIIESPIVSNFREGLSVLEYFISTHGARKGLADTALKTADAGYLTRRLVDVAQDVIITEPDCGTILGLDVSALKEGEKVIEPLADRILGRVVVEDVIDPISGEMIVSSGDEIREEEASQIEEAGIDVVKIRSVLTCECKRGVCAKCYGRNLATGRMVNLGEAVGVIAAQSIGEPGTQLTLRTFHIGGTAARIAEETYLNARTGGKIHFSDRVRTLRLTDGSHVTISRHGEIEIVDEEDRVRAKHRVPYGANLKVKDGETIEDGHPIFEWDPYSTPILSEKKGQVKFVDIIEDVTVREDEDPEGDLQDPRHHRRSSPGGRALRSAEAEGRGGGHGDRRDGQVLRHRPRAPALRGDQRVGGGEGVPDPSRQAPDGEGRGLRHRRRAPLRGADQPARHLADQGEQRRSGVPGQRDPGGLPASGREDQRQAHRGDRPPDAAEGSDRGSGRHGLPRRGPGLQGGGAGGERAADHRGRQAGHLPAPPSGNHQGVALHGELRVRRLLPGDHPRSDGSGDPRRHRPASRLERERDHGEPDPRRDRCEHVPPDPPGRTGAPGGGGDARARGRSRWGGRPGERRRGKSS